MFEWRVRKPLALAVGGPEVLPQGVDVQAAAGEEVPDVTVIEFFSASASGTERTAYVLEPMAKAELVKQLTGGIAVVRDLSSVKQPPNRQGGH
jgi:hypothetical protein